MRDNERDELATLLGKHESMGCGCCAYGATTPEQDSISDALDVSAYMVVLADAILAAGYRKPRVISTTAEIRNLPALAVVIHDDMAAGGPLQAFVVPDDGTVMFRDREEFHLLNFNGDYIDAKDMPLPLTVVYEVTS